MVRIRTLAEANRGACERRYAELVLELDATALPNVEAAIATLEASQASVNLRISGMIGFLATGGCQTRYEVCRATAATFGYEAEDVLRAELGPWYVQRTGFDRYFEGGESHCYGALYIAGLGLSEYGPFCLVFDLALASAQADVVCIDRDSTEFVDAAGNVNIEALSANIAVIEERSFVATVKYWPMITIDADWLSAMADKASYIEIIASAPFQLPHMTILRVDSSVADEYATLLLRHEKRLLTTEQRALLSDLNTFSVLIAQAGVSSEYV